MHRSKVVTKWNLWFYLPTHRQTLSLIHTRWLIHEWILRISKTKCMRSCQSQWMDRLITTRPLGKTIATIIQIQMTITCRECSRSRVNSRNSQKKPKNRSAWCVSFAFSRTRQSAWLDAVTIPLKRSEWINSCVLKYLFCRKFGNQQNSQKIPQMLSPTRY